MTWNWRVYPTPQQSQPLSRGAAPTSGPLGVESGVSALIGNPQRWPRGFSRVGLYPNYSDTYALQTSPTGWPVPEYGAQGVVRVPMRFSGPSRGAVTIRNGRLTESGAGIDPQNQPGCLDQCEAVAWYQWTDELRTACEACSNRWNEIMEADQWGAMVQLAKEDVDCEYCFTVDGSDPACAWCHDPQPPGNEPAPLLPDPASHSASSAKASEPEPEPFDCAFCIDMWLPECAASPCAEWLEAQDATHTTWDRLKEDLGIEDWLDWTPNVVPDDDAPKGSASRTEADRQKPGPLPVGPALMAVDAAPPASPIPPHYIAVGVGALGVALGAWWLWSR
jgi:hypothetical protein